MIKKTPHAKIYHGRTFSVHTTLPDLLRHPVGACCLYPCDRPLDFRSTAMSMAQRGGGRVCVESLLALSLTKQSLFSLSRVTVVKRCPQPENIKLATVNFCAPARILARCRPKTIALYENVGRIGVNKSANRCGAIFKAQKYHLIDLTRQITKPIFRVEVVKPGTRYRTDQGQYKYHHWLY